VGLNSSRLAIGNALIALLKGATDSSNNLIYQDVKLGAMWNPSTFTSWCAVAHVQGKGTPAGSGGTTVGWRIDEEVQFSITSGFGPYETDSTAAQTNMLTAMDVILPLLHSHYLLPTSGNPSMAVQSVYSVLPINADRSQPMKFPNSHFYLIWSFPIIVKQQYSVELVTP
jgi:hypothetical protein